jgi:hypothetical protein
MIFSQLFSPNYKSSDPEKRIASIEKLSVDVDKDKRVLHELAFNDGNDLVSLAALNKLDSFALWMKSAEHSASPRIKKRAQQACQALLENKEKVSEKLFHAYLSESKNKPLLEQLLFSSKRLQENDNLSVDILFSLNNENHLRRFFQDHAVLSQQLTIVEKIDNPKTLLRFSKSTSNKAVTEAIDAKLAQQALLIEKPLKIKQQVTMINSRLLALKDAQDYTFLKSQLDELSSEFDSVKADFYYLDDLSQATLSEKYLSLKVAAQHTLSKLEEAHNKQVLLAKTTNDISGIQEKCAQVQTQIDLLLSVDAITQSTHENKTVGVEVKILSSALGDASDELDGVAKQAQTQAHTQHIKRIASTIKLQQEQLSKVFDILAFAKRGQVIIDELSGFLDGHKHLDGDKDKASDELSQNNTASAHSVSQQLKSPEEIAIIKAKVDETKEAFGDLKREANDLLPVPIIKAFSKVVSRANKSLKGFNEHYRQLESRCESKLKAVNRMIGDGKFKAAMSTFHHVQKMYDNISETASVRVRKAYEQTTAEITKLHEWQAYIVQPRKPALLGQAEALSKGKFEDPYERVQSVKELRQEWNSLGVLHTEDDDAHNRAFDAFIETAFAPCRAFFAELERQRAVNYQEALAVIEEVKHLDASLTPSELSSKMGALKTKFNKIGDLDKSQVKKVKRSFSNALKPFNAVISDSQQQNLNQKQALIEQAKNLDNELLDDEALQVAVDTAKALQQKWKAIGFAGKNIDNQLWQAFRLANDALFDRFHQRMNEKKNVQNSEYKAIEGEINTTVAKLKAAKNLADLQFYDEQQTAIFNKAKACDENTFKKLQSKIRVMDDVYSQSEGELNKQRDLSALDNLFAFLAVYDSDELPDEYEVLLGRYKNWIKGDAPNADLLQGLSRTELCQVAAILQDIPHADMPIGEQASRQDIQLKMMAAKLQGDSILSSEEVLATWLSLGPVTSNEQESLQVLKSLFTA